MDGVVALIAFAVLSVMTLGSATMVVTSRNLVHAGFWLLPTLIGVAGFFAMLEAHYFVVIQILVYIGAILVLILFALMLTRDVMNPSERQHNGYVGPALAVAVCGSALMAYALSGHAWDIASPTVLTSGAQARELGRALIGPYAVPFEVASLVLLAALVGSIVVAKPGKDLAAPGDGRREDGD